MRSAKWSVKNGAVLRIEPQDPAEAVGEIVYQETETNEIEAFADFLRYLVDHYGPTTNRYSSRRIRIVIEPGDKFEPPANPELLKE
ncbi:MAG: hypothetical protein WC378_00375 [Opitutaceae bacterium]|jgi:hypothetical protein